jgi:TolA-binding protein
MAESTYFNIHKDIISTLQRQSPTAYFHLLYLVQEHKVLQHEDEISRLRESITELNDYHASEMNKANAKQREIIKKATKKYENMLERNKQEIADIRREYGKDQNK